MLLPPLVASGNAIGGTLPDVERLGCEVMVGDGTLVVIGALAVTSVPSLTTPTRYFFASSEPGATVIFDPSSKVITCFFFPSKTTVLLEVTVTRTVLVADESR